MQKHLGTAKVSSGGPAVSADAFLDILHSRRSVAPKRLIEPGPSRKEIEIMVEAALAAPDHGLLRPWQFVFVSPRQRPALASLFAAEKQRYQPDAAPDEIEKERSRAFNAPALLAVLLNPYPDHPRVPVTEQYISLGAAVQNILLAAHAMGYGAMLTSGRKVGSELLQAAFSPSGAQQLVGFISLGTPAVPAKPRERPRLTAHFADWSA
jgi:nitroreductase